MNIHSLLGSGVRLHVREWGKPGAPVILFIHGWSQNHLCWRRQFESELADQFRLIALDLRGHGMSGMPVEAENYTNAKAWADDIATVIDALGLTPVVLVGWSYAGFVICDYIRAFGENAVAGINFVGAAVTLNTAGFGTLIGPGFLDHVPGATADDLAANIQAVRGFVRACTAQPLPREEYESALCWNMVVPARIRAALLARVIDSDDVLRGFSRPLLMAHGRSDTVVLPAMGEHILNTCPTSTASWYDETGHAPFLEDASRFNRELAGFVRTAVGRLQTADQ